MSNAVLGGLLAAVALGFAASAHAQVRIGVTVSATGPAASLGISEKNTIPLCPKTVAGKSVEYILKHNIPGDIVECGVWKGGSMMAVARTLMNHGAERNLQVRESCTRPLIGWKARGDLGPDDLAREQPTLR